MNEIENTLKEDLAADGSQSGVEHEEDVIINPFNPDDISIRTEVLPLEKFIRYIRLGKINMAPDFQRSEVWNYTQKSQLIESLILSIPLPMFYVSADEKENWSVVDGLQRFSTIRDFILGIDKKYYSKATFPYKGDGFRLKNMEFFDLYNGLYFKNLPDDIQGRILDSQFNVTIIQNGTPDEVKFNIFKRINTGGVPLSPQEIRHALNQGNATDFLSHLSKLNCFLDTTCKSINPSRMADRELVLRLIAFIIRGVGEFKSNDSMDSFLNTTMRIINTRLSESDFSLIEEKFTTSMNRAKGLFGEAAFRKSTFEKYQKTPINKSLFDSVGFLLANLSDEIFDIIIEKKEIFKTILMSAVYEEQYFGRDSSKHIGVKARFEFMDTLVDFCLENQLTDHQEKEYGEIIRRALRRIG